ncbi:MAG: hypothetical protein K6F33_12230 [Bacteroidales bacterium]|nr:hypothetical protein [Bacteroidales bacterium]
MRKATNLIASTLIAAILALAACTQTPRELLIGEYKISSITSDQKFSPEERELWKEVTEQLKQTTTLILKADGSMEQTINGITQRGKWEVYGEESEDGEKIKLKIILESKATINMEIHDLTSSGFTDTEYDSQSNSKTQNTYIKVK